MKKFCCLKDQSEPELASAPSTIYPLEPEKPGKFILITGEPGIGKSTIALFLAQKFGFKYHEADGLLYKKNPYIPLDSKQPTLDVMNQRDMKVIIYSIKVSDVECLFPPHTLRKVKFLSKNSILTKPQHFHEFSNQHFFWQFFS